VSDRTHELRISLTNRADSLGLGQKICLTANECLATDESSLSLVLDEVISLVAAEGDRASVLEREQFLLGQGPSFDGARQDLPVLGDDLDARHARLRWPQIAGTAVSLGLHAAYAFPIRIGEARVGVLTAYRNTASSLAPSAYEDGLLLCSIAAELLLDAQAGGTALAPTFEAGVLDQARTQQAAGMIAEQLGITLAHALLRLRTAAFQEGWSLDEAARRVLDHDLMLEPWEDA